MKGERRSHDQDRDRDRQRDGRDRSRERDHDRSPRRDRHKEYYTLFVSHLPTTIKAEDVKRVFGEFGPIAELGMPRDYYTGRPKGYVFIDYENDESREKALKAMNHTKPFGGPDFVECELARGTKRTPGEMIQRNREKEVLRRRDGFPSQPAGPLHRGGGPFYDPYDDPYARPRGPPPFGSAPPYGRGYEPSSLGSGFGGPPMSASGNYGGYGANRGGPPGAPSLLALGSSGGPAGGYPPPRGGAPLSRLDPSLGLPYARRSPERYASGGPLGGSAYSRFDERERERTRYSLERERELYERDTGLRAPPVARDRFSPIDRERLVAAREREYMGTSIHERLGQRALGIRRTPTPDAFRKRPFEFGIPRARSRSIERERDWRTAARPEFDPHQEREFAARLAAPIRSRSGSRTRNRSRSGSPGRGGPASKYSRYK